MLFDLDGTLVDHDGAAQRAVADWLTETQLATEEQCTAGLVGLWDDIAERHFPAFREGVITFQEQRRRRLRDFLPQLHVSVQDMNEADLDSVFDDYLRHYEAAWRAYPDAQPCLLALGRLGLRLAVLSNGDQGQQEDKLRRTNLRQHFELVMTSGSLGAAKPSELAFHRACQRLSKPPASVVYVGDCLDVDAQAATRAGLGGIWLSREGRAASTSCLTIASLGDLVALVT